MTRPSFPFLMIAAGLGLAACGEGRSPQVSQSSPAGGDGTAIEDCPGDPGIDYLCGPRNAEDLVRLGESDWLLASGMNGDLSDDDSGGPIYLVDRRERRYEVFFPGEDLQIEQNMELFGDCPEPLDLEDFSVHGLAFGHLRRTDFGPSNLFVTSHGAREAVEVFQLDYGRGKPSIKWIGCVTMPETAWINSVAPLPNGGFVVTQLMNPRESGMADVMAGEITGHVLQWHPGQGLSMVEGTQLSGPNGIAVSDDLSLYVAATGSREVVRFDIAGPDIPGYGEELFTDWTVKVQGRDVVSLDIAPDNLRWSPEGTLYTAGGRRRENCEGADCGAGWAVVEIDPETLRAREVVAMDEDIALQEVSVALPIEDEIWVGTYSGDRLGILPRSDASGRDTE